MELFKNQYKNFILVFCYIVVATVVYVVSAECLWELWYIDVTVGIVVVGIGVFIGYKYIKSEEEARLKKLSQNNEEAKKEEIVGANLENEETSEKENNDDEVKAE